MTTIIGIDPGSLITGYGIIQIQKNRLNPIAYGHIRIKAKELSERLGQIYSELDLILQTHQPQEAAIEQVFVHKNPSSALKLGQARGAAITAIAMQGIELAEYSAGQVKLAVVGYGAAKKEQVQHMVKALLNLTESPQADTADALAIAICHAHARQIQRTLRKTAEAAAKANGKVTT